MEKQDITLWHISDTHNFHHLLDIPEQDINIIVFSGDESNYKDAYRNEPEAREFFHWYSNLTATHKVFISGNHSSGIAKGLITRKEIEDMGIIYLENDFVELLGYKIWGSPYSPTFGDWHFMKARHKMQEVWSHIPEDTDILITHAPPKGCLDLSYNRNGELEFCGCKSLLNRIIQVKPLLSLFGHLHSSPEGILNAGVMKLANYPIIFSNGSVVTDGKFGKVSSHGNLFKIKDGKVHII